MRNTRRTLTSQGVLGHTEAQGLQPVVDVRFSHGKLEFCRGQRVMLVTGVLRTKRVCTVPLAPPARVRVCWASLGGPGGTFRGCYSMESMLHSGSTNLRGHTPQVHCECGQLEENWCLRIAAQSHSLSVLCSEPASAFPSEATQPLPWPAGPTQSGFLLAPALVHSPLLCPRAFALLFPLPRMLGLDVSTALPLPAMWSLALSSP